MYVYMYKHKYVYRIKSIYHNYITRKNKPVVIQPTFLFYPRWPHCSPLHDDPDHSIFSAAVPERFSRRTSTTDVANVIAMVYIL